MEFCFCFKEVLFKFVLNLFVLYVFFGGVVEKDLEKFSYDFLLKYWLFCGVVCLILGFFWERFCFFLIEVILFCIDRFLVSVVVITEFWFVEDIEKLLVLLDFGVV